MGLFKSFKNMFSNDINPDINKFVGIVYPYPIKQIKINSKIIVPDNYYFCLGLNGKTLDGFSTGTYYLSPKN